MNKNAIKYFLDNKDKYPREVLINSLLQAGYSANDISKSIAYAYNKKNITNISSSYSSAGEKIYLNIIDEITDFSIGFFMLPAAITISNIIFEHLAVIINFFAFLIYLLLLTYFHKKRKYIFYGMLSNFLLLFLMPLFYLVSEKF